MKKVILPELGENITKAIVTYWHFQPGDLVKEGDDLVELATDKATFNLPSPVNGKLSKIIIPEGETALVGAELAEIE
jgi:pyruvate dehydrogenase E2 component (dihydrolipoamide acetyltransferase)